MTCAAKDISLNETHESVLCRTGIRSHHFMFTWIIENIQFAASCTPGKSYLFTEEVVFGQREDFKMMFRTTLLRPEFNKFKNSYVMLYMINVTFSGIATIIYTLMDSNDTVLQSEQLRRSDSLYSGELIDLPCESISLPYDTLKLVFKVFIHYERSGTIVHSSQTENNPSELLWRVREYFTNFDFEIITLDKKIAVHQSVLSANSPVFQRMLEGNFEEKKSGKVEINDFESEVVENLVTFMYNQKLPMFEHIESTIKLYEIADKYDVANLKEVLKKFFISVFSSEAASPHKTRKNSQIQDPESKQKLWDFIMTKLSDRTSEKLLYNQDVMNQLPMRKFTMN